MPWLVHHAAFLLNICKVGEDGRTAYETRKGKRFLRLLPEIGECIWYLRPQSLGKEKLDTRWENGVFAGVREESGELFVLIEKGADINSEDQFRRSALVIAAELGHEEVAKVLGRSV